MYSSTPKALDISPISLLFSRFPIATVALLSFLLLFSLSIFFHFTYGADDYAYLARVYSTEGLTYSSFGAYIYRVPLWSLFCWTIFHIARFVPISLLMYSTILIFCIAYASLSFYLFDHMREGPLPQETLRWIMTATIFSVFPNYYEILYWPTCMAYIPGLLFLAMAFRFRRLDISALFLAASFLTSEMFILPGLAFALFPNLARNWSMKAIYTSSRAWIAAIFLTWGIKNLIHFVYRFGYPYDLNFDFVYFISQIKTALIRTWTIHFYRTNGLLSLMYLVAIVLAFQAIFKKRVLPARFFWALGGTALLVTAIYWIHGHQAIRALFGAQVYIITVLVAIFMKLPAKKNYLFAVLFIMFIAQDLYIYAIKDRNFHVLERTRTELIDRIARTEDPCIVDIGPLDEGLRRDWVLPRDQWGSYLQWIKGKYFPQRQITFVIK